MIRDPRNVLDVLGAGWERQQQRVEQDLRREESGPIQSLLTTHNQGTYPFFLVRAYNGESLISELRFRGKFRTHSPHRRIYSWLGGMHVYRRSVVP